MTDYGTEPMAAVAFPRHVLLREWQTKSERDTEKEKIDSIYGFLKVCVLVYTGVINFRI